METLITTMIKFAIPPTDSQISQSLLVSSLQPVNPLRDARLRDALFAIPYLHAAHSVSELRRIVIKNHTQYKRSNFSHVSSHLRVSPRKVWKNMSTAIMYIHWSPDQRALLHSWWDKHAMEIRVASLNGDKTMLSEGAMKIPCGLSFEDVEKYLTGYFDSERFKVNVAVVYRIMDKLTSKGAVGKKVN